MRAKSTILCGLLALVFVANAFAATTYQVNTSPLNAVRNGVAEVMGPITLAASAAGTIAINDQIQIIYPGAAIANAVATGITVVGSAGIPAFTVAISNTSIGGQLAISFTAAGAPAIGDTLTISGVRASVVGRPTGFVQTTQFTAAPGGSSNFIVTSSPSVALVVDNFSLAGDTTGQRAPKCSPSGADAFEFDIEEESLTTWVQHVGGTLPGATGRFLTPFGANANTQLRVAFTGLPSGVTIDWPDQVQSGAAVAPIDSRLTLISATGAGNSEAIYGFSTADQAASDNNIENFHFKLFFDTAVDDDEDELNGEGEIAIASTASLGTAGLVAQLYPNNSVTTIMPRFQDEEKTEDGFQIVECVTNLLFPWIGSLASAGYETGFAIANTGYDVGALSPASTGDDGVIRLYFYPQTAGADPVAPTPITTAVLKPGDTYANTIGALGVSNKFGYMIAVCEFRFGHGFAFITLANASGPTLAQGYLALVLSTGAGTGSRGFPESLGE